VKRQYDVCLQMGHVARTKGATGTAGHRGSEQAFVKILGPMVYDRLVHAGLTVALIGADDPRPTAEVFLALHQDGSGSGSAHGASVGYPVHGDGATLAKIWKARYTLAGWPFGFRPDNYTTGLHWYYGFGGLRRSWWKQAKFASAFLIEHGFATTVSEENWMWDHMDQIAGADADAIVQYLKPGVVGLATVRSSSMDLSVGASGPSVRTLQKLLNMFSQAGLTVDGDFGPATKAAVIAYQTKLHVPADGVWGPASADAHRQFVKWLGAQPVATPPKPSPQPVAKPKVVPIRPVPQPVDPLVDILARLKTVTADLDAYMASRQ